MKQLTKQKKKTRITTKRIEKYTCRRCKTIKFDNNIKFHEHIRTRHAKKSKFVSQQSMSSIFSVSSSRSIIFSFSVSSKLIVMSLITFFFEIASEFLSIATSKKSISWAEIVSRFVASKFSRFLIATFKSMCKSLKNANVVCSSISSRIFTSSRFYFIVNDLFHMFVEKSNSFDLQRHRMNSFFSKNFDKCNRDSNFKNKCNFIQRRITLYFYAMITSVFKSIKFETFESTHVRENVSRQFSISRWFSISFIFFFSRFVSMRFFFRHFRVHFLFANIVKNVSSFIDLSIESRQVSQKLKAMKYSWRRAIEVSLLFILLWKSIDFFLKKSLLWKS